MKIFGNILLLASILGTAIIFLIGSSATNDCDNPFMVAMLQAIVLIPGMVGTILVFFKNKTSKCSQKILLGMILLLFALQFGCGFYVAHLARTVSGDC